MLRKTALFLRDGFPYDLWLFGDLALFFGSTSSQYNVSFKEWVGGTMGRSEHDYLDKEGPLTFHHKSPNKSTQLMKIDGFWVVVLKSSYLFIYLIFQESAADTEKLLCDSFIETQTIFKY